MSESNNSALNRLDGLSEKRRKLLELKLKQKGAAAALAAAKSRSGPAVPEAPPITKAPRDQKPPLSFAQQRLWFLNNLNPNTSAYNVASVFRVEGPLDAAALERTIDIIIARHEALRTRFADDKGRPYQIIDPHQPFRLPVIELGGLDTETLVNREVTRPFDLKKGPVLRLALVRRNKRDHLLTLVMHHIVSDGWSNGIWAKEISAVYPALVEGRPHSLPEPELQYADFAAWEQQWLQGEVLEKILQYWRGRLAGGAAPLNLPIKRAVPQRRAHLGARASRFLDPQLSPPLQALAKREGVTPFILTLALLKTLSSRYSDHGDITVGAANAGRNRPETEGIMGFFTNTLVMRTDLSGNPTFAQLLKRVKETVMGAFAHQDIPYEKLVELISPERARNDAQALQITFTFQNIPPNEAAFSQIRLSTVETEHLAAKTDLHLAMAETPFGIAVSFDYDTDIFAENAVQRMIDHLEVLLRAALADVNTPLFNLPLLTENERRAILLDWNDTLDAPGDRCLHTLIERQAARTPDAAALVGPGSQDPLPPGSPLETAFFMFDSVGEGGEAASFDAFFQAVDPFTFIKHVSYGEMERRANQLAHYLRAHGVGPEVIVGVNLKRSIDLTIALLATMKAGGAYLPLEPTLPMDRLAYLLTDADARVLLTTAEQLEVWPEGQAHRVALDQLWPDLATYPDTPPMPAMHPDHTLNMVYTSGSTGRPKGTMVPHRGIANTLVWRKNAFEMDGSCRLLQTMSISFDPAAWCLLGGLIGGAVSILSLPHGGVEGDVLAECILREQITLMHLPPSWLELFMSAPNVGQCSSLKDVITGAEVLTPAQQKRFFSLLSCRLHNHYGPTEASIHVTAFQCPPGGDDYNAPIGKPIANTRLYVLDHALNPLPVGISGELFLAGDNLARGYHGRPDQTAAVFVPDPFSRKPGDRMYKSGDAVRLLPALEGGPDQLEFLGRVDYQIKIRGYRVEPGEIESLLTQHEAVIRAVVIMREDKPGDKRLVAYVTLDDPEMGIRLLRNHLAASLPDYMVPSAFVVRDALPLTAHGKVDRKALPAPEQGAAGKVEKTPPQSETEQRLAEIWREVLGLADIGLEDHFFEMGGHSLIATQVLSRIQEGWAGDVSLGQLFENPVLGDLARLVDRVAGQAGEAPPPLVPVDRGQPIPLSFAQQRLWFLDRLEPGRAFYNIPSATRLNGPFDARLMEQALSSTVERHESLRTTFSGDTDPVQEIAAARPVSLPLIDISGLASQKAEHTLNALAGKEAATPFDLARGPLMRGHLIRSAHDRHTLLLTLHHIISDGLSMLLLTRELGATYDALLKGGEPPLARLTVQYADFAVWQRDWLAGSILEKQLAYWRERLAEAPPLLELPTDRPRPAVQRFHGRQINFEIGGLTSFRELARAENATAYMLLLAVFQLLLARYSGQTDVVVGSPLSGRVQPALEHLIGFFVNTLAIRGTIDESQTFRQLLRQTASNVLADQAHQALPFEKLVEELQPERSLAHAPLFQVMLVYMVRDDQANTDEAPLGEVHAAKFDLSLGIGDAGDRLSVAIDYNTDLFDPPTIQRLGRHFSRLLDAVCGQPDQPIQRISLMDHEEAQRWLIHWNATGDDSMPATLMHEQVEAQVERTPRQRALVFDGDDSIPRVYMELNAEANHWAHHLRYLGVGAETVVGVYMERCPEMTLALLAILKAGAAWLPLDPAYPHERLAFMLADAKTPVILTQTHLADDLTANPAMVIAMDAQTPDTPHSANPPALTVPTNAAYVIYTSGSTGRPKGVVNSHHGLSNRIAWMQKSYHLGESDVVLQKTPFSFDVSVWEFFWPLTTGASIAAAKPGLHGDPLYLAECIAGRGITTLHFVPSMLRAFLEQAPLADLPSLKRVFSSGEALSGDLERRFYESAGAGHPVALHNLYGPTEAAIDVTFQPCGPEPREGAVPIGRPIANTQIYILDRAGYPVPAGVPGELHIAGRNLARGYFQRPDLTAERFVPNHFAVNADEPDQARLYKTGDLARILPEHHPDGGALVFMGRTDHQIKLRGFRVELGEIERALTSHPLIKEAVVILYGSENPRLTAYVAALQAGVLNAESVRGFLAESLPDHMIPHAVVFLDSLPLTPSGKLDRKALPQPTFEAGSDATRTPTEAMLVGIWREVLGIDRVGRDTDFFQVGGHSLLATRLVSRLRRHFQVDLSLQTIFEKSRLDRLAAWLDQSKRLAAGIAAPPLVAQKHDQPAPLSFAQYRLWLTEQMEPGGSAYNMPNATPLKGPLAASVLADALSQVIARHEVLRTTFAKQDGEPVQIVHPAAPAQLPLIDLSGLSETRRQRETAHLARRDALTGFDLVGGPVMRLHLIRAADDDHLLLVNLHHIAGDAWSLDLLVNELGGHYDARIAERPAPFPPLPIQYADYARWQRDWLQGAVLEQQLAFWRQTLAGAPERLDLPLDRPRPKRRTNAGGACMETLPATLHEQLQALARAEGCTLFMVLLAAFQVLLHRLSGQADFCLGVPISGRNRLETENLIGMFVNTLVVRADLARNPSFRDYLARLRTHMLDVYAHEEMPFDKLVEDLKPPRNPAWTPIFQVTFMVQQASREQQEAPDLQTTTDSAKFDLTLRIHDQPDRFLATMRYSADVFEEPSIKRMLDQYARLLKAAAADPDTRIDQLPLTDQTVKNDMLAAFSGQKEEEDFDL